MVAPQFHGCLDVNSFQDTLARQVRNVTSLGPRASRPDPGSRCGEQVLIGPVTMPATVRSRIALDPSAAPRSARRGDPVGYPAPGRSDEDAQMLGFRLVTHGSRISGAACASRVRPRQCGNERGYGELAQCSTPAPVAVSAGGDGGGPLRRYRQTGEHEVQGFTRTATSRSQGPSRHGLVGIRRKNSSRHSNLPAGRCSRRCKGWSAQPAPCRPGRAPPLRPRSAFLASGLKLTWRLTSVDNRPESRAVAGIRLAGCCLRQREPTIEWPEPRGEPCAEIDQEHQNSPDRPADRGPVVPRTWDPPPTMRSD